MNHRSDIEIVTQQAEEVSSDQPNKLILRRTIKNLTMFSSGFIFASIVDVTKGFVINIYLARLGADNIAAGALISTSQIMLMSVCCCSFATGIEVGKVIKANNSDEDVIINNFSEIALTSIVFSVSLSIPLVVICANMKPIFIAFGQDRTLSDISGTYYHGYTWGIPAIVMLAFLQQFVIGHGEVQDAKLYFYSISLNTLCVSCLGYLLTFGAGDLPAYNILGLGATSSIVAWGNLIVLAAIVIRSERYNKNINIRSPRPWEQLSTNLLRYGTVGGAITVRVASEVISLFILTLMISKMGDDSLEAEQIAIQYMLLMIVPLFALSQATTIMASPDIALRDHQNITTVTKAGYVIGGLLSAIIGIVYCSASKQLISFFIDVNQNHNIYIKARNLLYINSATQIPDAFRNIVCGVLNAMEDPYTPLVAGVGVNVGFFLALGYVLGFPAKLGVEGVFIARLLTTLMAMVILQRAFVNFDFNRPKSSRGSQITALFSCRFMCPKSDPNNLEQPLVGVVDSNHERISNV